MDSHSVPQDLKLPARETLSSNLHNVDNGGTFLTGLCEDRMG